MSNIKPYKTSEEGKKKQVEVMFDTISNNYDTLNKLITFGMDIKWRKNVLNIIKKHNPSSILDIATGTGDMLLLFAKTKAKKILGVDISDGMLSVARKKIEPLQKSQDISVERVDAEQLNIDSESFDAVSIAYGIRNFENLNQGLSEILRVLNSKGVCVILETSVPTNFVFKQGYLFYTKCMVPLWGRLFSRDGRAYAYLSDSALEFPYGEALKKILEEVGFKNVEVIPQTQGISTIYLAYKS